MKLFNLFFFLIIMGSTAFSQTEIIDLWDGNVPNSKETSENEYIEQDEILKVFLVKKPTIEVYLPAKRNSNGKAVVICPGGGYHFLSYDWEGTDIAKWFNSIGVTAFVLKYRLPKSKSLLRPYEAPLQDAQRALRWVRVNAEKYNVNPKEIGIVGFSAGGHLASTLGTQFNTPNNFEGQEIDKVSARPDFMVLVYPVITFQDDYVHKGSRANLLGSQMTKHLKDQFSNELQVTNNTPPTFLVHSQDDKGVPVENSLKFYKALIDHDVLAEMHIYPYGGHGYSLAIGQGRLQTWTDRLREWLEDL